MLKGFLLTLFAHPFCSPFLLTLFAHPFCSPFLPTLFLTRWLFAPFFYHVGFLRTFFKKVHYIPEGAHTYIGFPLSAAVSIIGIFKILSPSRPNNTLF